MRPLLANVQQKVASISVPARRLRIRRIRMTSNLWPLKPTSALNGQQPTTNLPVEPKDARLWACQPIENK